MMKHNVSDTIVLNQASEEWTSVDFAKPCGGQRGMKLFHLSLVAVQLFLDIWKGT